MALSEYTRKRRFNSTSEPKGVKAKAHKKLIFVIQKHNASHLHYDFRLEMDGVLKSWAVPKGPSLKPEDKRLAMMVEDHPYDYKDFEGTIPKGNYGAGQVIVWDNGFYEPLDSDQSLERQLKRGQLRFKLHGKKLRGEFTLVRNKTAGDNAWLLIKKRDQYATDSDIRLQDKSVKSGQAIEGLNEANLPEINHLPKKKYPASVKPMLATLTNSPIDDKEWIYELKWDGYRAIGGWDGKQPQLYSRNGNDFTKKFSPISEALRRLPRPAVIDGEVVVVDKDGRPSFEALQNWQRNAAGNLLYYVFDVLWYDGKDLTELPLIDRRKVLQSLIVANEPIRFSDDVKEKGSDLFSRAAELKLEGIMAKKADSLYRPGFRSKLWLKVKTHNRQEVVIGGFTEPKGSRQYIGALVLGVYGSGQLIYIGHAGTGIPPTELKGLRDRLLKLEIPDSPFNGPPKTNGKVHWTKPELVCEVSFAEWTKDGQMRQPVFVGMREDKQSKDVVREMPEPKFSEERKVKQSSVKLSHLDKIFWPEKGYTKGDLLDYYRAVAQTMLPYLKNRPCNLLRQPNGIAGPSFYQKDMSTIDLPEWAQTVSVYSESNKKEIEYFVINGKEALFYLIQLGCIEINPWSSRVDNLDNPDWAVIDLDPDNVPFPQVVEVANEVYDVCKRLKIPCFPKTSGQTGIHVFIPTGGKYSYQQVRQFSELIANLVQQATDPLTSLVRNPAKRRGKIYLDYLQNRESQTLAAPYSVRPTKEASVSTPLNWNEVNKNLMPSNFTIKTVPARIKELGDLWKPVLGGGLDIEEAISRLEE